MMPKAHRIKLPLMFARILFAASFVTVFLLYFSNVEIQYWLLSMASLKTIPQGNRSFSEEHIPILKDLDLFDPSVRFDERVIFDQDPVFVSAWSSNHQQEAMILGNSLTEFNELPPERKKLIVYDIGLTSEEINDYKNNFGKMVQFRKFNFSAYPSYMQNLMQYRWKPLVIAEALLEFPVVWWVDSVTPFTNSKERTLRRLHDSIKNDPNHLAFAIAGGTGHSIFAATHPIMFDFLPMPEDKAKNLTMADASHSLWFGTQRTRGELLKWYVWCALEEDCMSPPGANVFCSFQPDRYLYYGNCHRFDQSAITIIATLITDYHTKRYFMNRNLSPIKVPPIEPLKKIPQGKRTFSEKHIPILKKLDLIDPTYRFDETILFDQDPVFVSAWSSDHQEEAMILGKSLTEFNELPPERKKLIVYDIGLTSEEINDYMSKFGKMVQFRKFNFSAYPSYVQNLMQYRWKPLVIAEALLEFPVVWWVDSVTPFTNSKERTLRRLHDSIKHDPNHLAFAIAGGTEHSIFAATHPGMFDFLPMPEDKAKNLTMADASHSLWFGTQRTRGELLKWYVWCALEEDCMSPPGATVYCHFQPDRYLYYGNCNRFDQSAITIIATLITDYHTERYFMNRSLSPIKVPTQ